MRKFLLLIAQCSLLILFVSCSAYGFFWGQFGDEDVDERSPRLADFGTVDLSAQKQQVPSIYSFLVFTDSHFGSQREEFNESIFLTWFEEWYKKYSAGESKDFAKLPRFAINLGDTADGGKEEQFMEYLSFEEKLKAVANKYLYGTEQNQKSVEGAATSDSNASFKVYSVLGNHDLYHNGAKYFKKLVYPYTSSYFFRIDTDSKDSAPGFSYYFLDTANGTAGTKQLNDFKKKIEADPRPKIVLTHYPIYAGGSDMFMIIQNTLERNTLLTYFAKNNVKQVYEGHAHSDYGFDFEKFREYVIGSLRFTHRTKKQCAIVTVNEQSQTMHTEIVKFN